MAQIEVQPLILKDVILSVAENDYEKHVSSVTFTPANSSVEWRGLSPDAVFTDPGSTTWSCTIEYAQDWETTDSFSRYLFENEGTSVAMTFQPKRGAGAGQSVAFTAEVSIIPGAIGGAVNAYATTSVTLGVQGRPELVEAGSGTTSMTVKAQRSEG